MPAPAVNIKTDPPLDGSALAAADRFQVGSQASNRWRAIEATELLRGLFLIRSVPGVLADLGVDVALAGKSPLVHTHPFADLGDGREVVEDYVANMFLGGTHAGVSVGYGDNGAAPGVINLTSAGVPGGATTQVQFNDGGAFGGDGVLVWDKTNKRLGVGASGPAAGLEVRAGATGTPTVVARAVTSQTADLTQWQDSTGTVLSRVTAAGLVVAQGVQAPAVTVGGSGLSVSSVPAGGQLRLDAYATGPNQLTTTNVLDLGFGAQPYTGYLNLSTDEFGTARLGWGTNSPANPVHVAVPQPQIRLGYSAGGEYDTTLFGDSGGFLADTFTGGSHRLQVGGTTRLSVGATGVGLGTSSPTARLDVRTGATTTIGQVIRGATSQTADLQQWQTSAGTANAALGADFSLKLSAATSGWKPGLWVSDNNATLGSLLFFEYRGGGSNNKIHALAADANGLGVYRVTDAGTAFVRAGNLPDLQIDTGGKVGLGTTAPGATLDVRSVAAATVGAVVRGAASQSGDLTQWQDSAGANLLRVGATGNLTFGSAGVSPVLSYVGSGGDSGRLKWGDGSGWRFTFGGPSVTALTLTDAGTASFGGAVSLPTGSSVANLAFSQASPYRYVDYSDAGGLWRLAVRQYSGQATPNAVFTDPSAGPSCEFRPLSTTQVGTVIKGQPAQTGDLTQWQDSTGAVQHRLGVGKAGFFGVAAASQQAGGAQTATGTWGATEQAMLQAAYDALRTFGFLN